MRDMQGLVDSLVSYIQEEESADDKVILTCTVTACDILNTAHDTGGQAFKMSVAMSNNHQGWR